MKLFTKLLAAAALLLSSQASFSASFTAADGNDWLQLSDTLGASFDQVDAACNTGTCSGTVGGTDITGYKFASNADVKAMFVAYAGNAVVPPNPFSDPTGFAGYAFNNLQGTGWNTDFNAGLDLTSLATAINSVTFTALVGFSSDSEANLNTVGANIGGSAQLTALAIAAQANPFAVAFWSDSVKIDWILGHGSKRAGAYLYKVSEVPVPAALFMFAPALLGFFGLRRKAKVQA